MWFISGFRKWSAYSDSLVVGPSHLDIIGLPGTSALCIFGRRYNVGFRVELSSRRNLWVVLSICPFLYVVLVNWFIFLINAGNGLF